MDLSGDGVLILLCSYENDLAIATSTENYESVGRH